MGATFMKFGRAPAAQRILVRVVIPPVSFPIVETLRPRMRPVNRSRSRHATRIPLTAIMPLSIDGDNANRTDERIPGRAMKVSFLGAVRTVTGSRHLVTVGNRRVLLDCGLYQGKRDLGERINRELPFDPASIDTVVLSHAHIDHSGNLPTLARQGFRGPIHATAATADLCSIMLRDSAHIQVKDAEFVNKHPRRRGPRNREPLYTPEDAEAAIELFVGHPYDQPVPVCEGVTVTFRDAGHILGSAILELDLREKGVRRRLVFTGDLGRPHLPILRDPAFVSGCDFLMTESTYGDRLHPSIEAVPEQLAAVVERVRARGGKILIPAFAVGRVQEIVWILKGLIESGRIQEIPIYVDSPLAVDATEIFARHPECFDTETMAALRHDGDPFGFSLIHYVHDVEDSKQLNTRPGTMVIISPSGMCEAGRVLHHLRNNIEDPRVLILIVGFQAEDTLGRRLAEGRPIVRIFGEEFTRRAEVAVMEGFSAHADREELLHWISQIDDRPRKTFVVHGGLAQGEALAATLREKGFPAVEIPEVGQEVRL
jgi:metallo-beta-lactamase family protein